VWGRGGGDGGDDNDVCRTRHRGGPKKFTSKEQISGILFF
jgi:hypothetical protein